MAAAIQTGSAIYLKCLKIEENKKCLETGENEKFLETGENKKCLEIGKTKRKKCLEIGIKDKTFSLQIQAEHRRCKVRQEMFTTGLVTTRRSILGQPAAGRPEPRCNRIANIISLEWSKSAQSKVWPEEEFTGPKHFLTPSSGLPIF